MFSKSNSKIFTLTNIFLLGQLIVCVIAMFYQFAMVLFPTAHSETSPIALLPPLCSSLVAGALLALLNTRLRHFITPDLTRSEKLFRAISLLVCELSFCVVLSITITALANPEDFDSDFIESIAAAAALSVVFLVMLFVVPRFHIFRHTFAPALNAVNLISSLGFGWNLAWFINHLIQGPADDYCQRSYRYSTDRTELVNNCVQTAQANFDRSVFIYIVSSLVLLALLVLLTKFGERLSSNRAKQKSVAKDQISSIEPIVDSANSNLAKPDADEPTPADSDLSKTDSPAPASSASLDSAILAKLDHIESDLNDIKRQLAHQNHHHNHSPDHADHLDHLDRPSDDHSDHHSDDHPSDHPHDSTP